MVLKLSLFASKSVSCDWPANMPELLRELGAQVKGAAPSSCLCGRAGPRNLLYQSELRNICMNHSSLTGRFLLGLDSRDVFCEHDSETTASSRNYN